MSKLTHQLFHKLLYNFILDICFIKVAYCTMQDKIINDI